MSPIPPSQPFVLSPKLVHGMALACCFALAPLQLQSQATGATAVSRPTTPSDPAESFVHESWTVRDGLPVNSVTALLQGRDGYIWISTFDGLARFDGVRFTVFNSANSAGLPTNRIHRLTESRDGTLWLLTEARQLVRFRDGVFLHIDAAHGLTAPALSVVEDARGTVWVGTSRGLGRIDGDRFVATATSLATDSVWSIVPRSDGSVWAGLAHGRLVRIVGDAPSLAGDAGDLDGETVYAMREDRRGTLWIATQYGVWRFLDRPERMLTTRSQTLVGFRLSPRTGEMWIESERDVFRVRPEGDAVELVESFPTVPFGMPLLVLDDEVRMPYAIGAVLRQDGRPLFSLDPTATKGAGEASWVSATLVDREGSIWLGTRGAGLHRLKRAPFRVYSAAEGIADRNVYSVREDGDGAVWLGSFDGHLSRLAQGRVTTYPPADTLDYWVKSLGADQTGRLWVGRETGIRVCQLPAMSCPRPSPDPIGRTPVQAIHLAGNGALWFGTLTALFRLESGSWHRFDAREGAPAAPVRVFQQTRDGALWMGTAGSGLARWQGGRFTHVTTRDGLPFDLVRSLYEDADGKLWVGTEGRGLARLDPREWGDGQRGGRIVSYRTKDGLFDEVIHTILEDDAGRLWMSTNRGIFWVERRQLNDFADGRLTRVHATAYTERDGLRNREANGGSQPAGMKSRDGRLWFATQDGVAVVDPARIQANRVAPNVVIEQVTAGGTAMRVGAAAVALSAAQRDLEIAYTALSFLAPANMRFRYRLEPYDTTWVDAGARRTAFYTRVPPGSYTFRVIASNNDDVWNETGATVELRLAPYLWERRSVRVVAFLLTLALAVAAFAWRIASLGARARELSRLVDERTQDLRAKEASLSARNAQLAELHESRSRLFANLSHEFRTPLTLILGPLRSMLSGRHGELSDGLREQGELMQRNGRRLLRLINQVLDLAKLQSGALSIERRRHDLVAFARTATLAFTPLAERRGVALHFHSELATLAADFDPEELEKVLLNLLSNALKFTEPGGSVTLSVARDGDTAVIAVRDTGVGISAEQLPRVFERFYQADASVTRPYEGTGIGLALVKELVELHGGTVTATSVLGAGSIFTIRIPLGTGEGGVVDGGPSLAFAKASIETTDELPIGREAIGRARTNGDALPDRDGAENGEGSPDLPADRTTVLIVDDNADVRAYVRSVLTPTYRVLEEGDGLAAQAAIRAELPDLVVADVMMPRLDGLSLARSLKGDPMTDAIPVVLLTARATPEDQVAGLATGADAYLMKPFDPEVLEACVANLLAQRRRLRERFRSAEVRMATSAEAVPEGDVASDAAPPAAPRPRSTPSALERRLRPLVEARLTDPTLSPETLAVAAGMSYQKMYRALRDEAGTTPSRFIRGVRVECAAERLRQGVGSVTEVAYSVGFESLSYFSRAFHERFGAAPSRYVAEAAERTDTQ